jgi:hypothetical protein
MISTFATEYFETDFTSYRYLLDDLKITDNLVTTECPVVEIPLQNKQGIDNLYQYCSTVIPDKFRTVDTSKLFNHWYTLPRSEKWNVIHCKGEKDFFVDTNGKTILNPLHITDDNTVINFCKDIFGNWWDAVRDVRILRLGPEGWCNPHRDQHQKEYGLCYFWIPLHEFSQQCMKIFPLGWLQHHVGSMYCFHQSRFPHAVQHNENFYRYVMIGRFHPDRVPQEIVKIYNNKKHKYLELFAN